jgi:hypothetical protein
VTLKPTGYIVPMQPILIALLAVVSACVAGCRSDFSPSFEAFSRNRLAVLAHNMESTRDSQNEASQQVTATVQAIKRDAWTGADPAQAYDQIRRLEAACDTRIRSARARLKLVQSSGDDFFGQWAKENTEYQDKDLRESSRQNRLRVKADYDAAIAQMKQADAATEPAITAIRDQVLFLKHHRNSPAVPERPANSSDPAIPAEALAEQTAAAAKLATAFAASARASPK